jgi:hypothetical protein
MTGLRDQWVEFIRSPHHAGRYLYAGRRSSYADAAPFDAGKLEEFLKRLSKGEEDIKLLSRLYYLFQPSVRSFFHNRLPDLIRSASHVTESEIEVTRRGARGKILWPQTTRLRVSGRGDAATFVVRKGVKSSDVPENRLLKLFLSNVAETVTATARVVGTRSVPTELEHLGRSASEALKKPYLREVGKVYKATSIMRQRARRNRNRSYGELADLQSRYDLAFRERKWSFILTLLQGNWLEPISDDNLFELYTLVLVLDVLATECGFGEPERYGLIRRDREAVATFRRGDVRADVYFNQSPVTFTNIKSEYTTILKDYPDLPGSARRPDITVRFSFADGSCQYLLLEVKKSEDERYGRDSVYKVLGYLRDFRELWDGVVLQFPKAILVFPHNITRRHNADERNRDLVFVSGDGRTRLAEILTNRAGTGNHAT